MGAEKRKDGLRERREVDRHNQLQGDWWQTLTDSSRPNQRQAVQRTWEKFMGMEDAVKRGKRTRGLNGSLGYARRSHSSFSKLLLEQLACWAFCQKLKPLDSKTPDIYVPIVFVILLVINNPLALSP